jgi:putative phage-type endonuclease
MKYPDCKLIDVEQRSDEWFEARKGHLTASQFGDWLTKTGKVAEKARLAAASKCLAELAGYPDPPPFETDDMRRGVALEPEARDAFQIHTGLEVDEIGFAKSNHGYFGCSPDGLILSDGHGLEIKCPRPSKLIQYCASGELPEEYKAQVHGSMAVTGAKAWHFFAYHPGFPFFHILVKRDTYTDEMAEGLKSYSNYFAALAGQMQELKTKQES